LPIQATDREADKLNITVKGWMNSQTYTTTYADAGVYTVTVIVSDGQYETKQDVKITVLEKNRPPVFRIPA
jgi:PKD repeat protein